MHLEHELCLGMLCTCAFKAAEVNPASCASDDSASMKFAENGERIRDLKVMLDRVTEVASLLDQDGISVRAINRCGLCGCSTIYIVYVFVQALTRRHSLSTGTTWTSWNPFLTKP